MCPFVAVSLYLYTAFKSLLSHVEHPLPHRRMPGNSIHLFLSWCDDQLDLLNLISPICKKGGGSGYAVQEKPDEDKHIYEDKDLAGFVDLALSQLDFNKDGYITYAEYRRSELARNTAEDRRANPKRNNWLKKQMNWLSLTVNRQFIQTTNQRRGDNGDNNKYRGAYTFQVAIHSIELCIKLCRCILNVNSGEIRQGNLLYIISPSVAFLCWGNSIATQPKQRTTDRIWRSGGCITWWDFYSCERVDVRKKVRMRTNKWVTTKRSCCFLRSEGNRRSLKSSIPFISIGNRVFPWKRWSWHCLGCFLCSLPADSLIPGTGQSALAATR